MKLGVNIDHIATLRQARGGPHPDPVQAARLCQKAGAHAVVMHLREDRRHVQDEDLFRVKRSTPIRLNLEMSVASSIVRVAEKLGPEQATLVPEKRMERTTEGGLDLFKRTADIRRAMGKLRRKGVEVSLFIDPERKQVEAARRLGADAVELHTGDYANAASAQAARKELARLKKAASLAKGLSLRVYAGHGLDYRNVIPIVQIREIEELNIGYSIVTRAVWAGFERAVREMMALL